MQPFSVFLKEFWLATSPNWSGHRHGKLGVAKRSTNRKIATEVKSCTFAIMALLAI